jgi:hypothetical protein
MSGRAASVKPWKGNGVLESARGDGGQSREADGADVGRGDVPAGGSPAARLPALASPAAHADIAQELPDVFGLVVGEPFDVPAVRGHDDQAQVLAVVQPLKKLLAPTGLLLRGGRVNGERVDESRELHFVLTAEPGSTGAAHPDDALRGLRPGVGEGVQREGIGIAPDDYLLAEPEAECLHQVG